MLFRKKIRGLVRSFSYRYDSYVPYRDEEYYYEYYSDRIQEYGDGMMYCVTYGTLTVSFSVDNQEKEIVIDNVCLQHMYNVNDPIWLIYNRINKKAYLKEC